MQMKIDYCHDYFSKQEWLRNHFPAAVLVLQLMLVLALALSVSNRHSGSVVENRHCDQEVAGSIPDQVIPKIFKMVLAALLLGAQH